MILFIMTKKEEKDSKHLKLLIVEWTTTLTWSENKINERPTIQTRVCRTCIFASKKNTQI
jgi:hypothetical protein